MNSKTKIKIYRIIIEAGAGEFIRNKINKLYSEHGISTEEVCLYVCCATYTVWLRTQLRANLFSLSF